ncbi:MAG: hypothetical protein ACJKTH_00220 [Patescibacteria group bacterium UBA2163]
MDHEAHREFNYGLKGAIAGLAFGGGASFSAATVENRFNFFESVEFDSAEMLVITSVGALLMAGIGGLGGIKYATTREAKMRELEQHIKDMEMQGDMEKGF